MALTIKKKSQNYVIDQGATFEKTIGAENSSSTAVTISSGTVAGGIIKNIAYANTLQAFTTSVTGANCTFFYAHHLTSHLIIWIGDLRI